MEVAGEGMENVIARLKEQLSRHDPSWIRFRTLVRLAGQENQSAILVKKLENAMETAKVFRFPASLHGLEPEDTVLISSEAIRDPGLPFLDEQELVTFILNRYKSLEPFKNCISFETQRQCDAGRIDICFLERGGGYVVCELEKNSGRFETASQMKAYMQALHDELTEVAGEAEVRGVVITGRGNPLEEAEIAQWSQETGLKVDWYYYRLGFELDRVLPSPPPGDLKPLTGNGSAEYLQSHG
jgi:hypothetical protein